MTVITTSARTRLSALAAGALLALAAHAQGFSPQSIDLPAAPLEQSLNALAQKTGVQIVFASQLAAGRTAPAVRGILTPRQALEQILAGSGLAVRVADGGQTYVVERPTPAPRATPGGTEVSLAEVRVRAQADRSGATEGTGSYTKRATNTATKFDLSPRETPQSVSVITRQRMEDQNLTSIGKVLEQTTGIVPAREGSEGTGYSYVSSRGFFVNNYQIDGIVTAPEIMQGFGNGSAVNLDSALYDHVGVVRGATGLLTGAGDPGATINLVRKKPTPEFQAHVLGGVGSWQRYRTEVDVAGPLTETGHVRARLVGSFEDGDSWQERSHHERKLAYGVMEFDLSENTLLTAGFDVSDSHADASGYGSFQLSDTVGNKTWFPRSRNAAADWAFEDMKRRSVFASLQQRFDNRWQATLGVNRVSIDNHADRGSAQFWIQPDGRTDLSANRFAYTPKQVAADFYASGPYRMAGREHELMFGLNYFHMERDDPYYNGVFLANVIDDVYAFDGNIAKPDLEGSRNGRWSNDSRTLGMFLATRLRPTDALSVILGARRSNYSNAYDYTAWGGDRQKESGVITPYAGVVYDLSEQLSAYASYTSIFKPQSQGVLDATGRVLDPETGNSYELGLKGEFLGGRLHASAAVFQMLKEDVAKDTGLLSPGTGQSIYVSANGVKAKGLELDVSGEPLTGWNLSAGYTLLNIRDDQSRWDGTGNVPRHQFKTFTTWKLPGTALTLGGGVTWQSTTRNDQVDNWQPGTGHNYVRKSYAVVNLMARYQVTRQLDLLLNVDNALDKTYLMNNWHHTYGAPRNLMLTAKYRF